QTAARVRLSRRRNRGRRGQRANNLAKDHTHMRAPRASANSIRSNNASRPSQRRTDPQSAPAGPGDRTILLQPYANLAWLAHHPSWTAHCLGAKRRQSACAYPEGLIRDSDPFYISPSAQRVSARSRERWTWMARRTRTFSSGLVAPSVSWNEGRLARISARIEANSFLRRCASRL